MTGHPVHGLDEYGRALPGWRARYAPAPVESPPRPEFAPSYAATLPRCTRCGEPVEAYGSAWGRSYKDASRSEKCPPGDRGWHTV